MIVLRHEPALDLGWACEQHTGVLATVLAGARERADLLGSLTSSALVYAGLVAAHDPDSPELDRALRLAAHASAGQLALALASPGSPVEVVLGDGAVHHAATGPTDETTAEAFRTAFHLAAVCRDRATLDRLATVPLASLKGPSEPCLLLRVRALQAFWTDAADAAALTQAARAAAEPTRVKTVPNDVVAGEIQPELDALRALVARDNRELNRALARALEAHKRLRGAAPYAEDPRWLLALAPLGLASIAHERGMRVEVQSDYLPLRLVEGDLAADGDRSVPPQAPARFVLCPWCGSPIARGTRSCPTCLNEIANAEPLELDMDALAALERVRCRACGEPLLRVAHVCPRCRAWQADADPEDATTDEVALRPFPPEYQAYVVARNFAPSRLAAILPGDAVPTEHDVVERLRSGGLEVLVAAPSRWREAPDAPWELDVEVRMDGDAGSTSMQIWPLATEALYPERSPASSADSPVGADVGKRALVLFGRLGDDLLRDYHRQLRVLAAIAPDATAMVDLETRRVRVRPWLQEAAFSPVPPEPVELYSVATSRSVDGSRAWMHTRGLLRCGCFELEMLDVPGDDAELFSHLLDAAARRLVERGEALPAEEQPFSVGEGVSLVWVPAAWARDDAPGAFGARDEDRVGFRALSAALLAAGDVRPEPIGSLLTALGRGPRLYESRLDAERDRLAATATLPRFRALRDEHGADAAWQFLVRLRLADGDRADDLPWFRVHGVTADGVDAELLGEPGSTGLARGHRGTWPLDRLVDWEVECPDGRITPMDALVERVAAQRTLPSLPADEIAREVARMTASRTTAPPEPTAEPAPARGATPTAALPRDEAVAVAEGPADVPRDERAVRNAVIASLIVPGLGQYWLGEKQRGVVLLGIGVVTGFLCGAINVYAAWDVWSRHRT